MLSDILLEKMQAAPAFQEDDGDGKVSVSALTRRDGQWSGGDPANSAHGRSHLNTSFCRLSRLWESIRPCPLSVSAHGPRCAVRGPPRRPAALCAQVLLPHAHLSPQGVC